MAGSNENKQEQRVDVAVLMRQVRRQAGASEEPEAQPELAQALSQANQQWNTIFEPLPAIKSRSLPGRLWQFISRRLHHEVRSYLDPMIYRQTEFNASIVRIVNHLSRRGHAMPQVSSTELESLRDEVIQLRERVRQLEERGASSRCE